MSTLADVGERIAEKVTSGYQKLENGVVRGYKAVEAVVVQGFGRVTDGCVKVLFAKEGETIEEAKARLRAAEPKHN